MLIFIQFSNAISQRSAVIHRTSAEAVITISRMKTCRKGFTCIHYMTTNTLTDKLCVIVIVYDIEKYIAVIRLKYGQYGVKLSSINFKMSHNFACYFSKEKMSRC